MNKIITPEIERIVADFSIFSDWEDKYAYLIDLGKKLPPFPAEHKTQRYQVQGCASQVWLYGRCESLPRDFQGHSDSVLIFTADSDAHIVRGLIALLLRVFSHQPCALVGSIDIEQMFHKLELQQYLSPSRSNGFFAMINRIKAMAQISEKSYEI